MTRSWFLLKVHTVRRINSIGCGICAVLVLVFFRCQIGLSGEVIQSSSGSSSPAPSAPPTTFDRSWSLGAQLRLRPEIRNNTDYGGNRNYTLLRFRMTGSWKPSPDTEIYVQPQFAKVFGDPVYVGSSLTGNIQQPTSGQFFDTALTMHQVYLDYHPYSSLQFIGGRQVLSYGDEVLIGGALIWANIGRSFDAIKLVTRYSPIQTDLFWSRLVDTATHFQAGSGSADFGGLYNSLDFGSALKNLDLYALYLSDTRSSSATSLWTLGTRIKSQLSPWDYRIEGDYQIGNILNIPQVSNQVDGEFGYTFDHRLNLRLSLGGFSASPFFNQLFPAAHKWLGTADVLGRRNISGVVIRTSVNPFSQWRIACDFHQFYRTDTRYPAYKLNGLIPLGSVEKSSATNIGTELDVATSYQLSKVINLSTGVSTLFPNDYLSQTLGNSSPMYAYFEVEARY